MYYTHPGCRTFIFGENRAYCIRDFTVIYLLHIFGVQWVSHVLRYSWEDEKIVTL